MILGKNWRKGLGIKKIKAYMILFNFHYGRQWHPTPGLSSALAWSIPWMEEPSGLQSMGSQLSNFTFTFHFHALEKATATHSSVLAWRIPGTGQPGGLPSMGSHGVGLNWNDLAAWLSPFLQMSFLPLLQHIRLLSTSRLVDMCSFPYPLHC